MNNNINDVIGKEIFIANQKYVSYQILQMPYCAQQTGTIKIPAIKLYMALGEINNNGKTKEKIAGFLSSPLSIKVNAMPSSETSAASSELRVGNFSILEEVSEKQITTNSPFEYTIAIKGNALTMLFEAPKFRDKRIKTQLMDINQRDTIIDDIIESKKTFVYEMIFKEEGAYSFTSAFNYLTFNPQTLRNEKLVPRTTIIVTPGKGPGEFTKPSKFEGKNFFIAIDISSSMLIEDYKPNRLEVVREGVRKYLKDRSDCDIGVIVFGGSAHHLSPGQKETCYQFSTFLDNIGNFPVQKGTSLGSAILLAKESISQNIPEGKLVIIGDGDNTTGSLPPSDAAKLAAKNNIRIYTIGVGNKGVVPYRTNGKVVLIEDTFSDVDLKEVARISGSTYYWAENSDRIKEILMQIFAD